MAVNGRQSAVAINGFDRVGGAAYGVPHPGGGFCGRRVVAEEVRMYKSILVPLDDSATAQRGLQEAIAVAQVLGARLTLLHVVNTYLVAPDVGVAPSAVVLQDDLRQRGTALLALAKSRANDDGVTAETVVVEAPEGRIEESVLEQARRTGCDLIVMGTHGRHGIARLVKGSNAELVLRGSAVPVLLVPDASNA
jgi:nucleotide-binding universal stress UspA family protein